MDITKRYDLAVIGGGLTGFDAAIRAAQLGASTVIIEEMGLGSNDAGRQSVPVRYLMQNAKVVRRCTEAKNRGLKFGKVSLNFEGLYEAYTEKRDQIETLMRGALKDAGVDIYLGTAIPRTDHTIAVTRPEYKTRFIEADKIILAGGCVPDLPVQFVSLPDLMTDRDVGLTGYLPKTLTICGYGGRAAEAAQVYAIFGSRVTILCSEESLLPDCPDHMNAEMEKLMEAYGVRLVKNVRYENVYRDSAYNYHVDYRIRDTEEEKTLVSEDLYYTGARRANLRGLDAIGLTLNGGFIETGSDFATRVRGFYAPSGSTLTKGAASGSARAGVIAVEAALGKHVEAYRPELIPHLIQTIPEACRIGLTGAEAVRQGYDVESGSFPLQFNDWAILFDGTEGFVDLVIDSNYGEILGAQAFGRGAAELITTVETVMRLEGTSEDLAGIIYPHPSLSEALGDAAIDALGLPGKKPTK